MPAPTRISTETKRVNYSASFTIPTDCTYVVALVARSGGVGFTATLGGAAMTEQVSRDNTDSSLAAIFTLSAPPTGSQTFAVSFGSGDYRATLVYYKNVGGTPVVGVASAGGAFASSFSLNCTSETDADVLDVITVQATGTITAGGSQTLIDNTPMVSPGQMFGTSVRSATGTPTALSWTTSASQRQAHCAIAIRGVAGGGPTNAPSFGRYGVRGPVR
jgi:hypothetical protein